MALETPNALDSEREVLAACFKGKGAAVNTSEVINDVTATLTPDEFVHPHYKKVFSSLQAAVREAGYEKVELGDVMSNIHPESAARETLMILVNDVELPNISKRWLHRHTNRLSEFSKARKINATTREVSMKAAAGDGTGAFEMMMDMVFALGRDRYSEGAQPLGHYLPDIHEEVRRRRNQNGIVGIETGMVPFDEHCGGLQDESLYYIGGRPGARKSVVIAQIAYMCAMQDKKVLLASPEMSASKYATRLACHIADLNYNIYNKGLYNDKQEAAIHAALDALHHENIIINQSGGQTTNTLREDMIRFKPDILLMDYAQLFQPSRARFDDYKDLSLLSKELMAMKKQFGAPIVAAVQLTRAAQGERPDMSHIRSTGQFEQDADVIWMLHNESTEYKQDPSTGLYLDDKGKTVDVDPNKIDWICAKNRDGEVVDTVTYVQPGHMWMSNERAA